MVMLPKAQVTKNNRENQLKSPHWHNRLNSVDRTCGLGMPMGISFFMGGYGYGNTW